MKIIKKSFAVNFDLSFLKIRWSDHLLIKDKHQIIAEAVVYGHDWSKAEKLAQEMARSKFGRHQTYQGLPTCEQVFINQPINLKLKTSNLKVKTGRNVFQDISNLNKISSRFPHQIRIDANQGYSLKQLIYLLPTLKKLDIHYLEEPVKRKDLPSAAEILHRQGFKIILDETLQTPADLNWAIKNKLLDVINLKISRIGSIKESLQLIKLAQKHHLKVIIGCSEELDRGMQAIYALGRQARKQGVLLEIEGFGPHRLSQKYPSFPRWLNKAENLILITLHRLYQYFFDLYWFIARFFIWLVKKTKLLSCLPIRLRPEKLHPKHLVKIKPWYLEYLRKSHQVLDIGCGNGQVALKISSQVKFVHGFDLDVSQAKKLKISNAKFLRHSAETKFPYPHKSFDLIIFFGVLEHLHQRDLALQQCYRLLKPKGRLLLSVPNSDTSWKILQRRFNLNSVTDPDHKIEYSRDQIIHDLEAAGFQLKQIFPVAYDTPWAGLIDLTSIFSLKLYQKLFLWKHRQAKIKPHQSNSFNIVAVKL